MNGADAAGNPRAALFTTKVVELGLRWRAALPAMADRADQEPGFDGKKDRRNNEKRGQGSHYARRQILPVRTGLTGRAFGVLTRHRLVICPCPCVAIEKLRQGPSGVGSTMDMGLDQIALKEKGQYQAQGSGQPQTLLRLSDLCLCLQIHGII